MLDMPLQSTSPAKPGSINHVRTHDGTELFYRAWGAGRPLLFLSGWSLNSLMWAYQMEPLAREGFRCVAYDRRGHGRSGDAGGGYDFDTLADDLAAVIDALGLNSVTVVAHSFASGEIVRYLTRHGASRIAGVIMLAPAAIPFLTKTADNPTGIDIEMLEARRAELADDLPGWAERNASAYFADQGSRGIIDATLGMMNLASHQALLAMVDIQGSTDFRAELAQIDIPMLFIHGDRDASIPLEITSAPACALVKGARLIVYKGGAHGLYVTHKARLNRDVAAFARGLGRVG